MGTLELGNLEFVGSIEALLIMTSDNDRFAVKIDYLVLLATHKKMSKCFRSQLPLS